METQEKKKTQWTPRYGPKKGEREYPQLTPEVAERIEKKLQELKEKEKK